MVGILFCWFGLKEPHWWWEKRLLTVIMEGLPKIHNCVFQFNNLMFPSYVFYQERERERVAELVVSCDLLLLMMERNDDVSF